MKPTHLMTLSAYVDSANNSTNNVTLDVLFTNISKYNDFLKQPFTLSMFVPCDKNGKPLIRPKNHEKWLHYKKEGFELLFGNEAENEAYNKALKAVIFEGWEVAKTIGEYVYLYNPVNDIELEFDLDAKVVEVSLNHSTLNNLYGDVSTLSKLANATTDNPLKLKQ